MKREVLSVTLSGIAHSSAFQKARKYLPSLVPYFKNERGEPAFANAVFRYPVRGLLSLRETPVSGEAFKLWFVAYLQRELGRQVEPSLLGMHRVTREGTYDGVKVSPPPGVAAGSVMGAPPIGFAPDVVDGELHAALERRARFIHGANVDIYKDCAKMAEFSLRFKTRPELRMDVSEDAFDRIAADVRNMAQGAVPAARNLVKLEQTDLRIWELIGSGAAFGYSDAAIDAVVDGCLLEIKPVRNLAAFGSSDQLLAYYILYAMEHPDRDIEHLGFYMARHSTFAMASTDEIVASFPVYEFGYLLFQSEHQALMRKVEQTFTDFCEYKRKAAGARAWEVEDEIVSVGRRYERAGRIGVTEIAEVRRVPPIMREDVSAGDYSFLPLHMQHVAESLRIERLWVEEYEARRESVARQLEALRQTREQWQQFAGRLRNIATV